MKTKLMVLALVGSTLSACATTYTVTPVDTGLAKVTYESGRSTTDLEQKNGAVKVTPLGVLKNGRVSFAVAAYNKTSKAANLGSENFSASMGGQPLHVYSYVQLEKEAKTAANWATVAVALSGAAAVYSANQNAYSTTNSTLYAPGARVYRATSTTYDPTAAALGTAAATAATAGGIYAIRSELDSTLNRLSDSILQTTTVEPDHAFGGQIIVAKPKISPPYTVEVVGRWNDEDYVFRFNVQAVK
ncbi:hypothetical protein SGCZBJ_12165 [Caulobacter zeae]|uniref:Uncharacterized protein n=1 Tax=Caulobacter zeae TaxID=2055137 RepID=A0A2N5DG18_9CAUL|nr:hypothetical protein [Caulobacter zeae]PLR24987.1 hypothetical protein SGCZBJ_12165 [Caulobacter zeae]